ncbi:MAG: sodium-dependent transporter [Pseudomonadota bacterium]|nr:sodium-dependent transporter [Pseudomonadota bacterium]
MTEQLTTAVRRDSLHGLWSSRFVFILAVTGSAVGLGNIWKFPYIAGENGGGAFVAVYLLCVFAIGLPIMVGEVLIGRRGRRNPVATMTLLGEEEAGHPSWSLVGILGVVTGFLILSFYSVIAGWTGAYIIKSAIGEFVGAAPEAVVESFIALSGSAVNSGFWHTAFMGVTVFVVARGVERGLEQAVRFMVPALVVIMLILLGYAMNTGAFQQGFAFLFRPDFGALTGSGVLVAMGQAFFTLSLGMGAVMAYGAYLPQQASIIGTSVAVVCADTAIAILAGLVIFPIVFANGLDPNAGPGLIFETLPLAFGQLPGGAIFGALFFLLLAFAALTSGISLMEPAVAWIMENRGVGRAPAAMLVGGVVWVLGFMTVLSFNRLSDFRFWNGTIFDNMDFVTTNIMLPLGGLFITLFAGWVMCQNSSADELDETAGSLYRLWRFLARYVAPVAVLLIFFNAIGLLEPIFDALMPQGQL